MTRLFRLQHFVLCLIVQISLYSQNISAQELQLPCDDCCEIGMLVSVYKNVELFDLKVPADYTYETPLSKESTHILSSTDHSGITINGKIYDFGLKSSGWGGLQETMYSGAKIQKMFSSSDFDMFLKFNNYYHIVFTVSKKSCQAMENFWNQKLPPLNMQKNNCHNMVAKSFFQSMDAETGIKEYFKDDVNNGEINNYRWGLLNFRKAYDHMVSSCGDQAGQKPRLTIYKSSAPSKRGSIPKEDITTEGNNIEDEDCQCQPRYVNPCEELIRLDLASGSDGSAFDMYVVFDIELQKSGRPMGYINKYQTTYTEVGHSTNGYPLVPVIKTETRDDGSTLTFKKVGGVDFTNLDAAASDGRILSHGSYDIITCGHPNAGKKQLPNIAQVNKFLKIGGEFRVVFFDFDYAMPITQVFVKEFQSTFLNVTITTPHPVLTVPTTPPMADNTEYVVSGIKKASGSRMSDNDIDKKQWIYPNPANYTLHIENIADSTYIELISILGKTVKKVRTNSVSIDVGDVEEGIYLLKISNGVDVNTQLLRIER